MSYLRKTGRTLNVLLRSVPGYVTAAYVVSVVCMNLLANREIYSSQSFCIDTGLAVSWIAFLCMDCVCKRFGGKAAILLNIFAMCMNLLTTVLFALLMLIPGHWAEMYNAGDAANAVNAALNNTFAGSWYVVIGSSIAMVTSGCVNAALNMWVGKKDHGSYWGFLLRSSISTAIAQWTDNLVFAILVSKVFFGWTWPQVFICATTSMIIELVLELIFSPVGYKMSKEWKREKVGQEYIDYITSGE